MKKSRLLSLLAGMFIFMFVFAFAFTVTTENASAEASSCCIDPQVGTGIYISAQVCSCNPADCPKEVVNGYCGSCLMFCIQ